MTKIKPIHKFNNSRGATLCHTCTVIITTGLTKDLYCERCKPKQETLEEVAEKNVVYLETKEYISFMNGVKWQQERSYSEEEVLDILYKHTEDLLAGKKLFLEEWFEQFKKK